MKGRIISVIISGLLLEISFGRLGAKINIRLPVENFCFSCLFKYAFLIQKSLLGNNLLSSSGEASLIY